MLLKNITFISLAVLDGIGIIAISQLLGYQISLGGVLFMLFCMSQPLNETSSWLTSAFTHKHSVDM